MNTDKVFLRAKGSDTPKEFSAKHAENLLAYPNTQWERVPDEKATATVAKSTPAKTADKDQAGN